MGKIISVVISIRAIATRWIAGSWFAFDAATRGWVGYTCAFKVTGGPKTNFVNNCEPRITVEDNGVVVSDRAGGGIC